MADFKAMNHFVKQYSSIDIKRSKFKMPYDNKLTMTAGQLVPVFLEEVLPGDTWQMNLNSLVRQITPAVPVMDNSYLDLYCFFVPSRLCTKNPKDWQEICGENNDTPWAPTTEKTLQNTGNMIDYKTIPHVMPQSVADYLGLPINDGVVNMTDEEGNPTYVSTLPAKGYMLIWNDWFRDQNLQVPLNKLSDPNVYYGNGSKTVLESFVESDSCLPVAKFHDRFTSCLPAPLKAVNPVLIPLLGNAPVITGDEHSNALNESKGAKPMIMRDTLNGKQAADYILSTGAEGAVQIYEDTANIGMGDVVPTSLYADLSQVSGATINQLRLAFAIQRLYEADARGGTRYVETLKSHFSTSPLDAVLQRPEYIGGKRVPLNITQVLQNSATGETGNPLGTTGAFGSTFDSADICGMKSFTEYGFIYVLACIRTEQTYSQGIPKLFRRNRRFDHYWPVFANLGEQPIKKSELFVAKTNVYADSVFGYNEAWSELRYKLNSVHGYMAPNANDELLTPWTYSLKLTSSPVLNNAFIIQPRQQIDDTLVVTTQNPYQFICDFYFDNTVTRPMPLYSIPGLQDLR